jgi:hypothetical protein
MLLPFPACGLATSCYDAATCCAAWCCTLSCAALCRVVLRSAAFWSTVLLTVGLCYALLRCSALCCSSRRPHPPSMGLPLPLKMRPSMSRDTGVFSTCSKQQQQQQQHGKAQ